MSDVIRRRADGSWGQGDDVPTYASDRAETWSGTRDESMEHVSDEYAKYLAMQKEWNMKEDIGKLYLQKECIDLLEENEKLKRSNKELLDALEDFVIAIEGYFNYRETDDIQSEDDIVYFIGEYRRAKKLIKIARGLQQ
jgi:hypothetical protein